MKYVLNAKNILIILFLWSPIMLQSGPLKKKGPLKQQKKTAQSNTQVKKKQKIIPLTNTPKESFLSDGKKRSSNNNTHTHEIITSQMITITNAITDAMITYTNHWAKPFPSTFKLLANAQEIRPSTNKRIPVENGKLEVQYECEFKKFGILYHREHRSLMFKVPPQEKNLEIKFSWYDNNRIVIANAQPVSSYNLDSQNS